MEGCDPEVFKSNDMLICQQTATRPYRPASSPRLPARARCSGSVTRSLHVPRGVPSVEHVQLVLLVEIRVGEPEQLRVAHQLVVPELEVARGQ